MATFVAKVPHPSDVIAFILIIAPEKCLTGTVPNDDRIMVRLTGDKDALSHGK